VGAGGVDPHADARGERLPVLDVALDRRAACRVEPLDAEVLDLVLPREPELLFDLDLDREAVAVPTTLARHVLAPHRLEARVDVLEDPGPHAGGPGRVVRGRGALGEPPRGRRCSAPQRLAEHVVLAPP